jgi:hypothetical protein
MKENIKAFESVELADYGIRVNRYLTYSQIQSIVDGLKKLDSWAERQQSIDMCILYFATDLKKEEIEAHDHDYWLKTGIIEEVHDRIENIFQLYDAIKYEESLQKSITQIARELPRFSNKVDEVMKNASIPSKK